MFQRILIANRGEIAVRVVRACRELGISPIVVHAPVDRQTLAVKLADVAVELKGATGRACYLDIPQLVEVASRTGCQAVHPGYGFLSENAQFSQACSDAGIVFIGPSPQAIQGLGNKNQARNLMEANGLPIVPGSKAPIPKVEQALQEAEEIGYPVLIKASGGGGGRGMRRVNSPDELSGAFEQARSESLAAFGSADIFLEKYVEHPRHIEIQILGDQHGHAIYLGERECSVQRRFQKMFEEAPSSFVTPELRQKMGQAAVMGALKLGYAGAGTFEFLVDKHRNFYFLEVNTRLQVEHPVTEMITGVDLVKWQIRIAAGQPLTLKQEDVQLRGWAFECRITCEDPYQNFLPSPGLVSQVRFPAGLGVRVDSHLYPGYRVPNDFDSMVAKLIVFGQDREETRLRTLAALSEMELAGVPSTIPFHQALLSHPEFIAGNLSTHFLGDHMPKLEKPESDGSLAALAVALELEREAAKSTGPAAAAGDDATKWREAGRREALRL